MRNIKPYREVENYTVICANSLDELDEKISNLISSGWEPIGKLHAGFYPNPSSSQINSLYYVKEFIKYKK